MRFYRALLHAFPRSFRAEYGRDMTADFARDWQGAAGLARVQLLLAALIDIAGNACRVHVDILRQDLRYSVRSLLRTPGFTVTAIAVAAIGIGATTATFTLADHVLIRALPFPDADRLVKVWQDQTARGYPRLEPSPPNFLDWQREQTSFSQLEAYSDANAALTGRGDAQRLVGSQVTPGVFRMLGRPAAIGRVLAQSDAAAEAERPLVISDRLWQSLFAASPEVLGEQITLDNQTYTIVGVMPADFFFPSREADFWRLLRFSAQNGDEDRGNQYLQVLGRLKDGVTVSDALASMKVIGARLADTYPKFLEGTSITLAPWRDQVANQPKMLLFGLVGASICVLLIACTNLANLLLSRALARRAEFAVRAAVGASVDRLVRQMLTDSLLLAGIGGVLGIVIAIVSLPLLVRLVPTTLPIAELPPIDLRMLAGTIVLTTVTGLAFGLLPALRVCRRADASTLKDSARGSSSRATERVRSGLVVAEIVASVVLIVCVGLLTQALLAVQRVDPGFRSDNVLTLRTQLPLSKYGQPATRGQYYARVLDRVHALPGVQSASYISFLPMTMRGGIWEVLSTNADPNSPGGFTPISSGRETSSAGLRYVTPRFFETIGTPIVKGRDISGADAMESPFVAVVSESFVKRHFPDRDPIGQRFAIAFDIRTIVGVVGDIKFRGLERISEPQVYLPAAQQKGLAFYTPRDLVIRASVPAPTLVPAVRAIIRETEPDMPVTAVQTLDQVIALETAPRLVQLRVLGGFAAIALALAAIGIHGLLGFTVTARTREIGVRMALGAKARDIMWLVVGRSTVLAIAGVALGVVLAYAAGRALQSVLFGVSPGDVTVFGGAIAVALVMAVAGSILPAWRATRIDPLAATRSE